MYTLWQGGRMLGRVCPELPGDDSDIVTGVLQVGDASALGTGVFQQTMSHWPGAPVWQHAAPPANELAARGPHTVVSGAHRATQADREGVPADAQLQLRDGGGHVIATRTIAILWRPGGPSPDVARLCAAAGVEHSGWFLIATPPSTDEGAP